MGNFTTDKVDRRMAEAIDFMVERVSFNFHINIFTIVMLQNCIIF